MRRTPVLCLLCVLFTSAVSSADNPAPAGSVREAIYFGPAGPVRLRFHVTLDGRPVDAVWAEAVDELFKLCDRNGDGMLDAAERAVFAPPRRMRAADVVPEAATPLRLTFDARQESVSRSAFAAAVRAAGFGPVTIGTVAGRPDSQQLSAALFRHLDRDGDGRLSETELKAARERLAFLDVNEDELLSPAELLGRAVSAAARQPVPLGMTAEETPGDSSDLVVLTPDGGPAVKQLLAARGGGRATSLRPEEFGTDGPAFAALDKDGNGRLDTAELTEWLRQPADLEFDLAFGPPGTSAGLTPRDCKVATDGKTAATEGIRFRFEPPTGGPEMERATWLTTSNRLREQFQHRSEKPKPDRPAPFDGLPALMDLADRFAGGKANPQDVDRILKALAPLAGCRVTVTFYDRGGGLFELLDRNGDGQLSPRELVGAAMVLKPFARPDGAVGPTDLPRHLEIRSAVRSVSVLPSPPAAFGPQPTPGAKAENSGRPSAPDWFIRMDRNGDGDVSLREFLGPIELFRKLDRDGDGLISPSEAWAAQTKNTAQ
jgi:Ca2+-binding EF-hand superfamily protein